MRVDFTLEELVEIRLQVGGSIDCLEESLADERDREDPAINRGRQIHQLVVDESILDKIQATFKKNGYVRGNEDADARQDKSRKPRQTQSG